MSKLVSVTFVKAWRGYSKKEVAGFDPKVAQGLVDGGFATSKDLTGKGKAASKSGTTEPTAEEKAAAEKAAAEKAAAGKGAGNEGKP